MPIPLICPGCSAKVTAPDSAVGKKVRCPKCQAAVPVPAAEGEDFDVEDSAPLKPKKKPVVVEDDEDDDRPRKKKPAAVEDEDEKPLKKKPVVVDEDDEDDRPRKKKKRWDDDEDSRPRKKVKKAGGLSMPVVIGGMVAVAAVIVVVILLTTSKGGPQPGPNAKRLPVGSAPMTAEYISKDIFENDAGREYAGKSVELTAPFTQMEDTFNPGDPEITIVLAGSKKEGVDWRYRIVLKLTRKQF